MVVNSMSYIEKRECFFAFASADQLRPLPG